MIVDIVDKYCTDDNHPIKNLRLKNTDKISYIVRIKALNGKKELGKDCSVSPVMRFHGIFIASIPNLKVPKCEISDRSDFPDFYTIKSC